MRGSNYNFCAHFWGLKVQISVEMTIFGLWKNQKSLHILSKDTDAI